MKAEKTNRAWKQFQILVGEEKDPRGRNIAVRTTNRGKAFSHSVGFVEDDKFFPISHIPHHLIREYLNLLNHAASAAGLYRVGQGLHPFTKKDSSEFFKEGFKHWKGFDSEPDQPKRTRSRDESGETVTPLKDLLLYSGKK